MINKEAIVTLAVLCSVVGFVYITFDVRNKVQQTQIQNNNTSAAFSNNTAYVDKDGRSVSLEEYLGKKVLAVSWASWCPGCVDQLKILSEIANDRNDLVLLAINRAEPITTATDFLKYHDLDTEVQLVMDPTDQFYLSVDGSAMPETVIYDSKGQIVAHERGLVTTEKITAVLLNTN